ncbi:MAG: hypothetical protein FVQ81_16665 [Candidatus Glassbacteria bacterium]|nr:hypothetical protein [Candidatus Glassbacteria bacterium]
MRNATPRKKFVLELEFEIFGRELNNVVTTCAQLNLHTEDRSVQGAMDKLNEAVKIFFDTAEARHELSEVLDALESGDLNIRPWSL